MQPPVNCPNWLRGGTFFPEWYEGIAERVTSLERARQNQEPNETQINSMSFSKIWFLPFSLRHFYGYPLLDLL